MDFDKLSRRDFLKKTTVLAVGVASVTLFSGLVNATTTYTVCKIYDGITRYKVTEPKSKDDPTPVQKCFQAMDCHNDDMSIEGRYRTSAWAFGAEECSQVEAPSEAVLKLPFCVKVS